MREALGLQQKCPQCAGALPGSARFCPACGARVAGRETAPEVATAAAVPSAALPAERRQVAVLFADLSGYTRLSSELDPEDVHRLLDRYFELVDGVVVRLGGRIDKHIGDAVMAVFGAPVAHGNDSERAARAACEIHAAMAALSAEFGRPLAAHVGIAGGEVVAATTGSGAHRSYTMTGDAVNLAARLDEFAREGETVISEDVYGALSHVVDADSQGSVSIRGLDRNVRIWKLRAVHAPPATRHPLLGREPEKARFGTLLDRVATRGVGTMVLIRADPGMGKTRLAEEFLAQAAAAGFACHSATVLDFGTGQGRDAIYTLCCSLVHVSVEADAIVRRGAVDSAIANGLLVPEDEIFVADLLAIPQRPGSLYEAMDAAARQRGKLRAFLALVERASASTPVLLLIDDMHWATPWILDCGAELAAGVAHCPTMVVLTSRREGDPITGTWRGAPLERFDLAPLADADALALARSYGGATEHRAARCVLRAQGNPLFLTQLLRSDADSDAVPGTIQSVVLARLDRLPPHDKSALQAASVIGQRFELALLRHLLDQPDYQPAGLIERELVRDDAAEDGRLLFAHALIRDGAYASLLRSTRRALHRGAAIWYADHDLPLHAEHLDRADDPQAAAAYLQAARGESAALRIESALRLVRRGADLPAPPSVCYAIAVFEGNQLRGAGSAQESVHAFERALAAATTDEERCVGWIGIAAGHRMTGTVAPAFEALDRAAAAAAGHDLERELARIDYLRGALRFAQGNVPACAAHHRSALEHAQRAGDAKCEAQALSGLADVLYAEGRMRSAHAMFERCVAICDREGFTRFALMNRCMIGVTLAFLGEVEAGLAEVARAQVVAAQVRHRLAEVMADECVGWILVFYGRYAEAAVPLEVSLALAREIGARRFEATDLALLACVRWHGGAADAGRQCLEDSWALFAQTGGHAFAGALVLGSKALMAGTAEERAQALAEGERLLAAGSPGHCHLAYYRDAIDASLDARDGSAALRYADLLEAFVRPEPFRWADFHVARGRALALALLGQADRQALANCRAEAVRMGLWAAIPALETALTACDSPV